MDIHLKREKEKRKRKEEGEKEEGEALKGTMLGEAQFSNSPRITTTFMVTKPMGKNPMLAHSLSSVTDRDPCTSQYLPINHTDKQYPSQM